MMWVKAGVSIIEDPGWSRLVCGARLFITVIRYSFFLDMNVYR